ncbi:unnamed protein product [Closterium sp. NIES-64]|nr:unnamed protein product [Closterium sp. NIES-64]
MIHLLLQALPYFYVPYDDDLPQDLAKARIFMRQLASALEYALKVASPYARKRQHVHACSLVRALPFYGYHPNECLFIKLEMFYPDEVTRAAFILQSGAVMGRVFQPYESHIPYLLQVKIDYNLVGMGLVRLSQVLFRPPLPTHPPPHTSPPPPPAAGDEKRIGGVYFAGNVPPGCFWGARRQEGGRTFEARGSMGRKRGRWCEESLPERREGRSGMDGVRRQSVCELEADGCVSGGWERREQRGEMP